MVLRGLAKPSSDMNVVFDGNSLVFGIGATVGTLATRTMANAPMAGSGASSSNVAISSQTWRSMNGLDGGSTADVDGAWQADKYNVLVAWESTNTINGGRSPAQCLQDCADYIAARQAVHPWRVVLLTTIPRYTFEDADLQSWNVLIKKTYRQIGADVLVDARVGRLNFDGTTAAGFQATQDLWNEVSAWIHLNDSGYQMVSEWITAGLRRLPARWP